MIRTIYALLAATAAVAFTAMGVAAYGEPQPGAVSSTSVSTTPPGSTFSFSATYTDKNTGAPIAGDTVTFFIQPTSSTTPNCSPQLGSPSGGTNVTGTTTTSVTVPAGCADQTVSVCAVDQNKVTTCSLVVVTAQPTGTPTPTNPSPTPGSGSGSTANSSQLELELVLALVAAVGAAAAAWYFLFFRRRKRREI